MSEMATNVGEVLEKRYAFILIWSLIVYADAFHFSRFVDDGTAWLFGISTSLGPLVKRLELKGRISPYRVSSSYGFLRGARTLYHKSDDIDLRDP
jgi:hypothetical protein